MKPQAYLGSTFQSVKLLNRTPEAVVSWCGTFWEHLLLRVHLIGMSKEGLSSHPKLNQAGLTSLPAQSADKADRWPSVAAVGRAMQAGLAMSRSHGIANHASLSSLPLDTRPCHVAQSSTFAFFHLSIDRMYQNGCMYSLVLREDDMYSLPCSSVD